MSHNINEIERPKAFQPALNYFKLHLIRYNKETNTKYNTKYKINDII